MNNSLSTIQGHLVLFCKNHYKSPSLLEGLRMIWAIRCGYNYRKDDKSVDRYIADEMYKIAVLCGCQNIQEKIHDRLQWEYRYEGLTALESLIQIYCCEIAFVQVREKTGKVYKNIIKLPKPKKQVFNRILRGNGRYDDYKLIAA